jgi:hypothetical protein
VLSLSELETSMVLYLREINLASRYESALQKPTIRNISLLNDIKKLSGFLSKNDESVLVNTPKPMLINKKEDII